MEDPIMSVDDASSSASSAASNSGGPSDRYGGGSAAAAVGGRVGGAQKGLPRPTLPARTASCAAALAVASRVVAHSDDDRQRRLGNPLTSSTGSATSVSSVDPEHERLSRDLVTFLSDPALRNKLASGSLDLSSYSTTVRTELEELERECIDLYRTNGGRLSELRTEMDACDAVLASLQEMLLGFQADLAGLSGDIRTLQEQSQTLGVQLRNRRDAELKLRAFLERIVVPPNLADVICTGAVDETFVECVKELEDKFGYVHIGPQTTTSGGAPTASSEVDEEGGGTGEEDAKEGEEKIESTLDLLKRTSMSIPPSETTAGREMRTHLLKLRLRAVARTREYFLSKFAELRRPRTNVRMIQVNALLRYSDLNDFLLSAAPDAYSEVRDVYVESMGKTLHALFRTYAAQLTRLDMRVANRNDLIALDDGALRDAFSTKVNMSKRADAFHLGDRVAVLDASDPKWGRQPISAHVALAEGERYPYERIFKSVMTHLMDAATNEYVFVRQFFKENGADAFGLVFSRTLGLVLEQLENYLFDCHDALGILLMIKLTHQHRRTMRARKVDALDAFFDRVANLLWPRLKMVVDAQIRSVRTASAKKLGGADLHPHVVGRRYAEFMSSCLLIFNRGSKRGGAMAGSRESRGNLAGPAADDDGPIPSSSAHSGRSASSGGAKPPPPAQVAAAAASAKASHRGSAGDMLLTDLSLLTDETVRLLERLSEEHRTNKDRCVFLINNADQILCIFQERRVSSGREVQRFADLLRQQRELFVEEELLGGFSKMIAFVQQTEAHLARGGGAGGGGADVNPAVVEGLVREFASSWKSSIEQINRNVLSYFSNFRNGMEILKQVLTQLLLYYTRFQDIIRRVWRSKPPAFCKDLVSTTVILAEIKKYALAI